MKKVAVILSGCGNKDGSEITEAVSTLIALAEANANYKIFAPAVEFTAVDHLTNETQGKRNALTEAGRIARGQVQDLRQLQTKDFDALVLPGGLGAAKVLCTWGTEGAGCKVLPEVERVLREFHQAGKPIGAICIAPALVARVLGKEGVTVTIGDDAETSSEIAKTGAHHENCAVNDYVSDREHKVVTTPAYMYGTAKPHQIFAGIRGLVKEVVEMA